MRVETRVKQRIPQVPSMPLPALAEFLAPFRVQFAQANSADNLERYVTGLMTEHPNKNCDTMARVVPGTHPQRLHHLLTDMLWDEVDLNHQRIQRRLSVSYGDGVLLFDDTGVGKQGKHSAGVARQYSGTFGKVTNCQVTVNCHYAQRRLAWPLYRRLYLPRQWAEDPKRRKQAHVPEEVQFQTQAEIALSLLEEANRCGARHACVVVDADYGDNPNFLNGLEARHERYVVAVRGDFSVALGRGVQHQAQRADTLLQVQPACEWVTIRWREGSRGTLRAKFVAVRLYRVDGEGARHLGWLIGQRPARGQSGERKYFWSNFPAHLPLEVMVEYTHRRVWVEQYHEEAKSELGWDHYQGRRWDGFHRHAGIVMLSYSFLVWLEWKQRQARPRPGPPRRVFSPKAGSAADPIARNPSIPRRMVAVRGHLRTDSTRSH
ncbi:MAG TPA: IS701 family transposase [Gammaproteobacteria bacterium]|nr:IS701 family transposase [Gammaproteobacteria bacterium]